MAGIVSEDVVDLHHVRVFQSVEEVSLSFRSLAFFRTFFFAWRGKEKRKRTGTDAREDVIACFSIEETYFSFQDFVCAGPIYSYLSNYLYTCPIYLPVYLLILPYNTHRK